MSEKLDTAAQVEVRHKRLIGAKNRFAEFLASPAGRDIPDMLTILCDVYPLIQDDPNQTYYLSLIHI